MKTEKRLFYEKKIVVGYERLSTLGRTQTGLGPTGCCILPGSDTGSNGVEPVLGFVIKNYQTTCYMLSTMRSMGHAVKTCSAVCSVAPHWQSGKEANSNCAWRNGIVQDQSAGD